MRINDFSKIKLIVTDFDGVWTDNKVYQFDNGHEAVLRSKSDSMGIDILENVGLYNKEHYKKINHKLDIIILSKETNYVVKHVGNKISVKYIDSVNNKVDIFRAEVSKRGLDFSEVIFIGNDFNDIECIKLAGIGIAVNDAYPEVRKVADYITKKNGGDGAIREVIDILIERIISTTSQP